MRVESIQPETAARQSSSARPAWFYVSVFAGLLALVLGLQYLSGTYTSEFGGYPDEPAHYATSLMVRDYLVSGDLLSPMKFANDYYAHYPKVAFGHWPPLLYVIQGPWMLIFSESRASVLVELALSTALAAFLLFVAAARRFGWIAGVLAAALLICLPEIQTYTNEEMAESLLLLTTFQAAVFFARYLETRRWQDSFWFGIFCSLAILTKGTGWALVMIPPIAIVLTRSWSVLWKPSFWIPVPVVGALCLPWQILTLELANRGWPGPGESGLLFALRKLVEFGLILPELLGYPLAALAVVGIVIRIALPLRSNRIRPFDAVMLGLIVCMWVFHSVVPVGVENRKMINALPALILFAIAGGEALADVLAQRFRQIRWHPAWPYAAVTLAFAALFFFTRFSIPKEEHFGYTELSSYIEARPELHNASIFVSSERDGEGLLISELLMQDRHRPDHTIIRATKTMSVSDWNGKVSELICQTPAQVMSLLEKEKVTAVVVDSFPRRTRYRHHELLLEAMAAFPERWTLLSTFGNGRIRLYGFR